MVLPQTEWSRTLVVYNAATGLPITYQVNDHTKHKHQMQQNTHHTQTTCSSSGFNISWS